MSDDPRAPDAESADAPASESEPEAPDHDVVLVHGRTDDGQGIKALRSRPGRLEAAEIRPLKEGQPLNTGELVSLGKREGSPLLWDVDVLHNSGEAADHEGPPRVTTARYRRNWDEVFGATSRGKKRRRPPDESSLN